MDINTIKQRLNNIDPNSMMASVISLIGSATTTDLIAMGYFAIAAINSYATFTSARRRSEVEIQSMQIANKQKEEELKAAQLRNEKESCSIYCTPESCTHKNR